MLLIERMLINRVKTPFESWFGRAPHIDHLRIFGSAVYSHTPKEKRQKLDCKSEKGILVGYGELTKGYRIWFEDECLVEIKRDVLFNEFAGAGETESDKLSIFTFDNSDTEENSSEDVVQDAVEDIEDVASGSEYFYSGDENESHVTRSPYNLRNKEKNMNYAMIASGLEPKTYDDALKSPELNQWKCAMNEEIESLRNAQTWSLVNRPKKVSVLKNRWVFKMKTNSKGHIERYKARLVVKGFEHKGGIDYGETFTPVVRINSIRLILALAAKNGWCLRQFDVKTAFLYGRVDEDIYMEQPKGYEIDNDKICKLVRSLYGLKQSPRCWGVRFSNFIKTLNFVLSKIDNCVFVRKVDGIITILAIYVDDGLIVSNSDQDINNIIERLQQEFEMKVEG